MKQSKLVAEVDTLKSFFETYCSANNHQNRNTKRYTCNHREFSYAVELQLCRECQDLMEYSLIRLEECPHEIKPRCRTCLDPCYEKKQWKSLAKVMRYSGLRLGIVKVKKMIGSILPGNSRVK